MATSLKPWYSEVMLPSTANEKIINEYTAALKNAGASNIRWLTYAISYKQRTEKSKFGSLSQSRRNIRTT